jgi:hypothetical protein
MNSETQLGVKDQDSFSTLIRESRLGDFEENGKSNR